MTSNQCNVILMTHSRQNPPSQMYLLSAPYPVTGFHLTQIHHLTQWYMRIPWQTGAYESMCEQGPVSQERTLKVRKWWELENSCQTALNTQSAKVSSHRLPAQRAGLQEWQDVISRCLSQSYRYETLSYSLPRRYHLFSEHSWMQGMCVFMGRMS